MLVALTPLSTARLHSGVLVDAYGCSHVSAESTFVAQTASWTPTSNPSASSLESNVVEIVWLSREQSERGEFPFQRQ